MRKTIDARMQPGQAKLSRFYLTADMLIDRLIAMREEVTGAAEGAGYRLSLTIHHSRIGDGRLATCAGANVAWAVMHPCVSGN